MSYSKLFEAVQTQGERISTRWLMERAIEFSTITRIKEQWSGVIDNTIVRGFYIEGPMGPPVPLRENEALITLARGMCVGTLGEHWRRFIYTKELMHVFDDENEKTDNPAKFDLQIDKFSDPAAAASPQFRAEQKAFWRALGVLCTRKQREKYQGLLDRNEISFDVVAAALRLPVSYIRGLFREDFQHIIDGLI